MVVVGAVVVVVGYASCEVCMVVGYVWWWHGCGGL